MKYYILLAKQFGEGLNDFLENEIGLFCKERDHPIVFSDSLHRPRREKTCLRWSSSNKGAVQPAHPRSLNSTFAIRL